MELLVALELAGSTRKITFRCDDIENFMHELENSTSVTVQDNERGAKYVMVRHIVSVTVEVQP